jgi:nucleoside triphosphate pyrophosphatase
MKDIILASASPRRKELLNQMGISFKIIPSTIEENINEIKGSPAEKAETLAHDKASDVAKNINKGIVIGSDTIVVLGDKILGKPKSKEEAFEMLRELSGGVHEVITGITVIDCENDVYKIDHETTKVYFDNLTDDRIRLYIESGESEDKAGAYGIQGKAAVFVKKIEGCYFNVVGLPINRLNTILREFNVKVL